MKSLRKCFKYSLVRSIINIGQIGDNLNICARKSHIHFSARLFGKQSISKARNPTAANIFIPDVEIWHTIKLLSTGIVPHTR